MNRRDLTKAIFDLCLDSQDYVVVGSGVIGILGLRDVGDVDVIVSERVFKSLESSGEWNRKDFEDGSYYLTKGLYEVGLDWDSSDSKPNLRDLKKDQVIIQGIPFVSVKRLMRWKLKKNRPKDLEDIELLKAYLS